MRLRHDGIYRSEGYSKSLGRGAASRWSGPGQAKGRDGRGTPCPSYAMSSGRLFLDRGCGRDEHRCPPPAQIRTGGITAYGSSLGYERGSAHQDMDVEFVGEEATGRRSASVVPSRAAVADCDVVKCAASSDRAVLEIDRAQPSCPEPHGIGSSPPPRVSTTLR